MIRKRVDVVEPDWPLVAVAARIKAEGGLSYADALWVATAIRVDAPLWTGDPEIVEQADEHSCEVVDLRHPARLSQGVHRPSSEATASLASSPPSRLGTLDRPLECERDRH